MSKTPVAAIQSAPSLFDKERTIAKFEHLLREAKNTGADLVVFPEAFLGGYPKGVDFGARVGSRTSEGRDFFRQYYENAFDPSQDSFARIQELVKSENVNVVTGLIEPVGGTLYCVAATLNRSGEVIGWHRKLMPTAMERLIWGMGDGSTMKAAQSDIGIIGTAICWENYMPNYRAHLYNQGTQLYCAPTVDDREVWLPTMQMIALEGRCFVISACQYMTRDDVAVGVEYDAVQGNTPDTVLIKGGSSIISPAGEVLAGPARNGEAILTAELDMNDIPRGKYDLDVAGHYSRPDIFSLEVNETSRIQSARTVSK